MLKTQTNFKLIQALFLLVSLQTTFKQLSVLTSSLNAIFRYCVSSAEAQLTPNRDARSTQVMVCVFLQDRRHKPIFFQYLQRIVERLEKNLCHIFAISLIYKTYINGK